MSIIDVISRSGMQHILPTPNRAPTSLEVAQEQETRQDTLRKQLEYREALRQAEVDALARRKNKSQLEFDLANQDELMAAGLEKDRVDLRDPVLDDVARDVPFIRSEADYGAFIKKHGRVLPKEFFNPDGSVPSFKDGMQKINDFRKSRMYNIEHQRAIELADIRASEAQPQFPASKVTPRQQESGFSSTDKFLKDEGIDLGDLGKESDARELAWAITEMTAQVNQAAADAGRKINENDIRKKMQEISKKHIKDNRFNVMGYKFKTPVRQDYSIDWQGFNDEVNSTFGLSSNYGPAAGGESSSGPAVLSNPDVANPNRLPPPAERVLDQVYQLPSGQFRWKGTGWEPVQ